MKKNKVSNYELFREEKGITNPEMIEVIAKKFPSFGKIQASMVNNPTSYGVQLHAAAEIALAQEFGDSKYLSAVPQKQARRKSSSRNKGKKAVWIPKDRYAEMAEEAKAAGYDTVFEYILAAMKGAENGKTD